jgi:hypothetical protein
MNIYIIQRNVPYEGFENIFATTNKRDAIREIKQWEKMDKYVRCNIWMNGKEVGELKLG